MLEINQISSKKANLPIEELPDGSLYFISESAKSGSAEGGWAKFLINRHWETVLFKGRKTLSKCISEELTSKICKQINIPCQNSMLVKGFPIAIEKADDEIKEFINYVHKNHTHDYGIVCFDFLQGGENGDKLIEGEEITPDFAKFKETAKLFESKYGANIRDAYLESQLLSAFLMNTDPNINNYGIIEHSNGTYSWAPNYDNESTLFSPVTSACGDFINGTCKDQAFSKLQKEPHSMLEPIDFTKINDIANRNTCNVKIKSGNKYENLNFNEVFIEIARAYPNQATNFANKLENLKDFDFYKNCEDYITEGILPKNYVENFSSFMQRRILDTTYTLNYYARQSSSSLEK